MRVHCMLLPTNHHTYTFSGDVVLHTFPVIRYCALRILEQTTTRAKYCPFIDVHYIYCRTCRVRGIHDTTHYTTRYCIAYVCMIIPCQRVHTGIALSYGLYVYDITTRVHYRKGTRYAITCTCTVYKPFFTDTINFYCFNLWCAFAYRLCVHYVKGVRHVHVIRSLHQSITFPGMRVTYMYQHT